MQSKYNFISNKIKLNKNKIECILFWHLQANDGNIFLSRQGSWLKSCAAIVHRALCCPTGSGKYKNNNQIIVIIKYQKYNAN